jgi:AmmeMemoRadiSam system protein B
VGAAVYADVFRAAVPAIQSAELVIIFGTDHFGGQAPFTLTRQHFATPLGVLPTAQRAGGRVSAGAGCNW